MSDRPLNLVIFGVDSLRADHMSCYGYKRLTTPHIDRLASRGVLFENAYSAYIPTTPAYAAMLTGMDTFTTQVVALGHRGQLDPKTGKYDGQLTPEVKTLPEILRKQGYVSACVGGERGPWRGFDRYAHPPRQWIAWADGRADKAEQLNNVTLPLLDEMAQSGKPFFLFLRHMDPHAPYLPPAPYERMFYSDNECRPYRKPKDAKGWKPITKPMKPVFDFKPFAEFFKSWMPPGITDAEYVIAQYDGALAYMDACIARLLTRLEELGVAENTLIILNGDHGETLYDHEIFFDHHGLYEPTLHVPLIIVDPRQPQWAGKRVKGFTLHQDLVPTVLELLGIQSRIKFDGQSVVPLITGERATNYTEFYITECTWMRKRGWRTPVWKFWEALEPDFHNKPPVELYNLIDDPEEYNNLADKEPKVVETLRERMLAWIEKRKKETGKGEPIQDYQIGLERRIGSIATAQQLQAQKGQQK